MSRRSIDVRAYDPATDAAWAVALLDNGGASSQPFPHGAYGIPLRDELELELLM